MPLWDNQIHGEGQVVAIADTGIDYGSCYFLDSNYSVPIGYVNMLHRKIGMMYDH